MEPEVLVFMPNGDVTLTLLRNVYEEDEKPTKILLPRRKRLSMVQQTPIDENKQLELEDKELEDLLEDDESILFYAPDAPNAGDGPSRPPSRKLARGSDASSRRDRSSSPPSSFWAQLKRQQAAMGETAIVEDEGEPEAELEKKERKVISSHEVHCVVSSRHMMLASQVFETLLKGDSTAAKTLRAKGHVKIQVLADFDTLVILLNIVHGPSRKVPRQVTLDVLSNLAILVSKFGMIEAVQFFSDTWIDALQREGLPRHYNEAVLQLMFVFWVFDRPDEFKNMTRLAQRECTENLFDDAKELPIPHNILDAIKREREYGIETAITIIHTLISRYMEGNTICDASLDEDLQYACDAMILGSLMKSSRKIDIWPRPEAPFTGRKFKDLARAIRGIRIVDVCNRSSRRAANLGSASNGHGLQDEIEASMKDIESGMDGLELLQYPKKSDDHNSALQMFVHAPEIVEEVKPPVFSLPPVVESIAKASHVYTELESVPESSKEEAKPPRRGYSTSHARIQSPLNGRRDGEEQVQERVRTVPQQPIKPLTQDLPHLKQQTDSRTSSRASDYQVQEPSPSNIREEQKPTISRSYPSQEWMNPGRVVAKPSAESYSIREPEVRIPKDELNVYGERKSNFSTPTPNADEREQRHFNGNSNGIYGPYTKVSHEVANVEAPSAQQRERVVYTQREQVQNRSPIERRVEQAPSDESFLPSRRATQIETASQADKSSYNGSTTSSTDKRSSPSTEISYSPKSERNSYAEPSSPYAVKKPSPPPEISYSQSQRTSYPAPPSIPERPPVQLSQSEKLSHAVSQLEAARAYIERNASNKAPQPEPLHQSQRPAQSERHIQQTQTERPSYVPQSSHVASKPAQQEGSQSQSQTWSQQQSPPTKYASNRVSQHEMTQPTRQQQQPYQSSYTNGRIPQQDVTQQARPLQPTPQSSYTSTKSQPEMIQQQPKHYHQTPLPTPPPQQQSKPSPPPQAKSTSPLLQLKSASPPNQNPHQTQTSTASANRAKEHIVERIVERPTEEIAAQEKEREITELEESLNQPQKFNMRKSKKKFSTRF